MASIKFNLTVEMEDETTYSVIADQRDLAAWESHTDGRDWFTHQQSSARFLAWNALSRTGALKMTWNDFNNKCVEVFANAGDEDSKSE